MGVVGDPAVYACVAAGPSGGDRGDLEPTRGDRISEFLTYSGARPHRPRLRRYRRAGAGLLAVLLAVAIVAVAAVGSLWLAVAGIRRDPSLLPGRTDPVARAGVDGALNLMLIGTDASSSGAAEVLLMVHVDADRDQVHVLSVPRELLVPLSGGGQEPIGAAFARVGSAGVVTALEDLLQVRVDHVAVTRLEAMARLIDLLDGITVNNPLASSADGHVFTRGPIILHGQEALAFVRQGEGRPGDLDRAESQRLVLQGIVERLLTSKALLNPGTVKAVLNQLAGDLVVDSGLDTAAMVRLFIDLRVSVNHRALRTIELPTAGRATTASGAPHLRPDAERIRRLGDALTTDRLDGWVR